MEILELKNGSVNVNSIGAYTALKNKLDFVRKRLNCTTNTKFKCEYFRLGDYGNSAIENVHYIMLSNNRNNLDDKLKQEIIDFLTTKFIEQMNEIIKQMNDLIE